MVWTDFVKGSCCCHNPFKTSQHIKDYNELVSKYHWKRSSHYISTLPSPFIFLNRHLIHNQNAWIKNMEISAQKLHIHCLFWSSVSQIPKSLWQSEACGVKVLPSKGVGVGRKFSIDNKKKRQSQSWENWWRETFSTYMIGSSEIWSSLWFTQKVTVIFLF